MPPPPGDITTPCPPHVFLSSPWSTWTPGGGTSPGPLAFPPSPLNSHCRTVVLNDQPPYTSFHGHELLILYLPTPLQSPPTTFALSFVYDTPSASLCCYRQFSAQNKGRLSMVAAPLHWYVTRPYLPQISDIWYRGGVSAPIPFSRSPTHSAGCLASWMGLGYRYALTWGEGGGGGRVFL